VDMGLGLICSHCTNEDEAHLVQ